MNANKKFCIGAGIGWLIDIGVIVGSFYFFGPFVGTIVVVVFLVFRYLIGRASKLFY